MDFLDWVTKYQSDFQPLDARFDSIDPVDYQYEKIIADKQRKDNADCARCNHMGAWHKDTGTCELCDTRCVFQFREDPKSNVPKAGRSKYYAYDRAAHSRMKRHGFYEPNSRGLSTPSASSANSDKIYTYRGMPEKDFQDEVIRFAELHKWSVVHTFSRKVKGWPDLVLVRPPEMVCLELKSQNGNPSSEQIEWIRKLDKCPGVVGRIVKPSDREEVEQLLRVDSQRAQEVDSQHTQGVAHSPFFETRRRR